MKRGSLGRSLILERIWSGDRFNVPLSMAIQEQAIPQLRERKHVMRRFTILLVIVSLLGFASPAGATTTRTDFTGTQQAVAIEDPGEEWLSGPIQHVRGRQILGVTSPDPSSGLPVGTSRGTINVNFDTTTLRGRAWGSVTIDFGDGGFETTFSGAIGPAAVPGGLLAEYRVVGHGFGSMEGVQLRANVRELILTGTATFEGTIFTPGDR